MSTIQEAIAAMERAKKLRIWDDINHALHIELDVIFKYLAATQAPSAPVAPDAQALLAARAEGRAEAVLIIQAMNPEDALNDCMCNGPSTDGEYDVYWDEEKLREKFKTGDATLDMESKAEMAYWDYQGARYEIEFEADQRRAALSVQAEPIAWIESEPSVRGCDPRSFIHGVCNTVMFHTKRPMTTNPVWPLYLDAPTPPTTGEAS